MKTNAGYCNYSHKNDNEGKENSEKNKEKEKNNTKFN